MLFRVLLLSCFIAVFADAADRVWVDATTKEFKKYIDDVFYKYNTESKSQWYIIPVSAISATKETIPGVTYHIELSMAPSNCTKNDVFKHIQEPSTCKSPLTVNPIVFINAKIYISQVDNVEEISFEKIY